MIVSNLFLDIYKNFNISNQVDNIKKLTRKERLLLITLCIDSFESDFVIQNYKDFRDDLLLLERASDSTFDEADVDIKSLFNDLGAEIVLTSLTDLNGHKLPAPISEEQARIIRRDLVINNIIS